MPKIAAINSSPEVDRVSTPNTLMTTPSKIRMARLVAKNRTIRNTSFLQYLKLIFLQVPDYNACRSFSLISDKDKHPFICHKNRTVAF
jgi:hypothetical protein